MQGGKRRKLVEVLEDASIWLEEYKKLMSIHHVSLERSMSLVVSWSPPLASHLKLNVNIIVYTKVPS